MVTAKAEPNESYVAAAMPCQLDPKTGRPTIGHIMFNLSFMKLGKKDFQANVETTLHELTHVLGFTNQLFKSFRDKNGNVYEKPLRYFEREGKARTLIATPKVIEVCKKHFGCEVC